jgi:hypothetical protein
MKRTHSVATLGLALVAAGALVHCGSNAEDDIAYPSTGYYPDASAYDGGTSSKDGATDGSTACVSIDYSQARSCAVPVDAGADADAGDAGSRSNAKACRTSFDCAGICCSCPAKDAGADAAPADAGPTETFTAYACACGVCQVDQGMCAKMAAGDPTLCP